MRNVLEENEQMDSKTEIGATERADWKRATEIQSLAIDILILWYLKSVLMELSRNN